MNKKIILILAVMFVFSISVVFGFSCSDTITRTLPSNPEGSFDVTYTYHVTTPGDTWAATIEETLGGGCTKAASGGVILRTVMLYTDGDTKTVTINPPSGGGTCTFNGDYGIANCLPYVNFPSASVTVIADADCVDSTWSPATGSVDNGVAFTQTSNCGTTRSATGTRSTTIPTTTITTTTPAATTTTPSITTTFVGSCQIWEKGTPPNCETNFLIVGIAAVGIFVAFGGTKKLGLFKK